MTTRSMSRKVELWALSQVTGFPLIKSVLMTLAYDADADGKGNISLRDLCRYTEITEREIPGILHSLENFGMALASTDPDDGTIRYRLLIKRLGAHKT